MIRKNKTREELHRTYGGLVSPSDFNTQTHRNNEACGSVIAQRIMADRKFDEQLIRMGGDRKQ